MADTLRLAVVQPRTIQPNEEANVDRALGYIVRAAGEGAQVVVLPECYPGPYSGPICYSAMEPLAAVAREYSIYVGYGFMEPVLAAEVEGEIRYHNVYQVLGPRGSVVARYCKVIPSPVDEELSHKRLVAGDELVTFETPWAKIGLLICWEAWFPELSRTLAAQGADVVIFPTGGMLYHLAPVWRQLIQARATENLIYTASCVSLFGVEDGFAHINAPEGEIASKLDEGVLVADLDLARLRYLRAEDETLRFPKLYKTIPGLWRYVRPELYRVKR
jgi:predicted amidohydrolase